MVEYDGVTQMQGVREKIRDRENFLDLSFGVAVNIFIEEDRGFVEVGNLTRRVAEVIQDSSDGRGFLQSGSATKDQIVSKEQGVDWGIVRSQLDTRQICLMEFLQKANGEFINGHHKKVSHISANWCLFLSC